MNATPVTSNTTAAAPGLILALDLGKFKSIACAYPRGAAGRIRGASARSVQAGATRIVQ